jgi:hypothetical protein
MRFNVALGMSWITGRNGSFAIPSVEIYTDGAHVMIDGIGQRGYAINGGFHMDAPSFFTGVIAFLEENGYKVTPPCTQV